MWQFSTYATPKGGIRASSNKVSSRYSHKALSRTMFGALTELLREIGNPKQENDR